MDVLLLPGKSHHPFSRGLAVGCWVNLASAERGRCWSGLSEHGSTLLPATPSPRSALPAPADGNPR